MIKENSIAIILTSHNREGLIQETLESIRNQSFSNFHCYIIDDFSTDTTADVIKNFISDDSRFSLYPKNKFIPKGLSASRNYGLDLIKGKGYEFIQFFDDDDLMHPEKLKIQIEDLQKKPKAAFSLCGSKNFKISGEINWNDLEKNELHGYTLWDAYLIGKIKFVAQAPLFRASFFRNYRFDEELFYAEEWVLFVQQFYKEKPEFCIIDQVLFYRRKHLKSITAGGSRNFNVRKTSAIAGIKVFDYLSFNNLNTEVSILHYSRYFLLYNYDSGLLQSIRDEIKKHFPALMFRFKLSLYFHKFFRKLILRILKY